MNAQQASSPDALANILSVGLVTRPQETAILDANDALSFSELDKISLAAAQYMSQTAGVCSGDRVLVLADKRLEIVPAAIAIWKAGAIYVPVDPDTHPGALHTF
jgi:D-alanine--poly(phosphoribitol) ligase subunit 1